MSEVILRNPKDADDTESELLLEECEIDLDADLEAELVIPED